MINIALEYAKNNNEIPKTILQKTIRDLLMRKVPFNKATEFLKEMSRKGETENELFYSCEEIRKHYNLFNKNKNVVEIIGTGGDNKHTFNISTATAIVAAASNIPIVKFGNKASSSLSGATDVLDALGVQTKISPENSFDIFNKIGLCYFNNNYYPPPMQAVSEIRHKLEIVTLFNKIRWINPSGANMEFLGVYSEKLMMPIAKILCKIGVVRAFIVHGMDGMDEASVCSLTKVVEINNQNIQQYYIKPEIFGLRKWKYVDIIGGSPNENARIIRDVFDGKEKKAKLEIILMNSALVIKLFNPSLSFDDATEIARETIDSGAAKKKLEEFIKLSNNRRFL